MAAADVVEVVTVEVAVASPPEVVAADSAEVAAVVTVAAVEVAVEVPAEAPVEAVEVAPPLRVTVTAGPTLGMARDSTDESEESNTLQRAREAGRPWLGCRDWRGRAC